jgi:hypothetical protein
MPKSRKISAKVRKLYKKNEIDISPVMAGMLAECDRIQAIQDDLWQTATSSALIVEYTNKSGASNLVAGAALRELRSWELVFQGACRSIFNVLRADMAAKDVDIGEELAEFT